MLVRHLIESLRTMPQDRLVEIYIPADTNNRPDEEPANKDDLYADAQRVYTQGDVIIIKGY